MRRRAFLLSATAAAFAATGERVVDTHIHLYDPERPQGVPWPAKTDSVLYRRVLPDAYAAMVRPLGVTGAIVVEASPWVEDNQWVLDLAKDSPLIAGVVGHLEPGAADYRANLKRFARNPLFRGIRVNGAALARGLTQPKFVEDLRELAGNGLALDAIGNAEMVRSLLVLTAKIPGLRVAIDHMPGEPVGWAANAESRAAMRELSRHPQVYAKVSGVIGHKELLGDVWQMFGPDRVMYGSNWPVSDKVASYGEVLHAAREFVMGKGEAASEKFFWKNSKACYQWPDRV